MFLVEIEKKFHTKLKNYTMLSKDGNPAQNGEKSESCLLICFDLTAEVMLPRIRYGSLNAIHERG